MLTPATLAKAVWRSQPRHERCMLLQGFIQAWGVCVELKVCELFAGVGGLTLGGVRAGMDIRLAVELDSRAVSAHMTNFPKIAHYLGDVASLSGKSLAEKAGLLSGEIDGIIGGPPCQGFSIIGKRQAADERNSLLGHFSRLVTEVMPRFFVMENVTGLLHERNETVLQDFLTRVGKSYQIVGPLTVSASAVGAPTSRTRVFYLGFRSDVSISGVTSEGVALRMQSDAVYVGHALQGLPLEVDEDWKGNPWGRARTHSVKASAFRLKILDDRPISVGSAEAVRLLDRGIVLNHQGTVHSRELRRRYSSLGPGEQDLITKSVRLRSNGFCPTLRAGTGKERGSFQAVRPIHPRRGRVISPREAARLQSFPDWFVFDPTKWQAFRQIGNSVPPLLGEALLRQVGRIVRGEYV